MAIETSTDSPPPPPRPRRAARWVLEGLALVALVAVIGAWQTRHHLSAGAVPAFTLPTLDGHPLSSSALAGKPTVLVLWAPWCGVCKAQSDNVNRVQRWLGARANVVSIALAWQDRGDVERYVREGGVEYPVVLGSEAVGEALRVEAYPTTYFLDESGNIKRSAVGYVTTLGLLARWWW
jgi:thiol-disulfide isomerase/thioredoxin